MQKEHYMKKILILLTFFTVIFISCDLNQSMDYTEANTAELAETSRVVENVMDEGVSIISEQLDGTQTFTINGDVSEYPEGNHLFFAPSEVTPDGKLLKILSSADNGDGTVSLVCENGLLEEALVNANISYAGELAMDDVRSITNYVPTAKGISWSDTYTINFDEVDFIKLLEENIQDINPGDISQFANMKLNGKIKLNPSIYLDMKIRWFRTNYAIIDLRNEIKTTLSVEGGLNYKWDHTIPLFEYKYSPIVVMLGPVPVVFNPVFEIALDIKGNLISTVKFEVSQTTNIRLGAEKPSRKSGWRNISSATFNKPTLDDLTFKADFDCELGLREKAGIYFYGVVGVNATLTEFARFSADIDERFTDMPLNGDTLTDAFEEIYKGNYVFDAGIRANINFGVTAFGRINKNWDIWGDEWILAKWELNDKTGFAYNNSTKMYGKWSYPAIAHLIK